MRPHDEITIKFIVSLQAFLRGGTVQDVHGLAVDVTVPNVDRAVETAHALVPALAEAIVRRKVTLRAPLDHIELIRCRLDSTSLDELEDEDEPEYQDRD
jgi:hypothetical protein